MSMLAVYFPKPEELDGSIAVIALAYIVLCACAAWFRLSIPIAAVLMAAGGAIAVLPGINSAANEDLGKIGDLCRTHSQTDHSDAFFAITAYFHVGRGKPMALLGMSLALVGYASCSALWERIRQRKGSPLGPDGIADFRPVDPQAPEPGP